MYLFLGRLAQYTFWNACGQDWNEKVHLHIRCFSVLRSSTYFILRHIVNPKRLHIFSLLNARPGPEYLRKLRALKCLNDRKEKNIGNSFWHHPNALKCRLVLLPTHFRRTGRLRLAIP